jgi:hypothetical protein
MMSNLGRHAPRDLDREIAAAYGGDVPLPFYLQPVRTRSHRGSRHHPGALEVVLPYCALPLELLHGVRVSLDELDELLERRARREEADS